jgi:hypothetical protein
MTFADAVNELSATVQMLRRLKRLLGANAPIDQASQTVIRQLS